MKLLAGWSRVTFLGLLVVSLGLTLMPTHSGNAQAPKVLRVGLAEDPDIGPYVGTHVRGAHRLCQPLR